MALKDLRVVLADAACDSLSLCYTLQWTGVTDSRGPADKYRTKVLKAGAVLKDSTGAATFLSYTFTTAKPLVGDSAVFVDSLWAGRRTLWSAPTAIRWVYRRGDAAPPTPKPPVVDSTQVIVGLKAYPAYPADTALASPTAACLALAETARYDATGRAVPTCYNTNADSVRLPSVAVYCAIYTFKDGHRELAAESTLLPVCQTVLARQS